MKKVKFAEAYQNGVIVYPDAVEKFAAITVQDGFVYATYFGDQPLTEAEPPYTGPWHITKLAFRSRFTPTEKAALEAAAAQNNALGYGLRASMADQRDALYIDLKRADTIAGVQALEAATLLQPGRAATILETPPVESELFRG
jgi:hypothetical protein